MSGGILPLELSGVVYEAGGRRLLDGVDLRLESGGRSLVLGPNGAGKSLTLRIAHGLLAPSAGGVRWAGAEADGGNMRRLRSRQAMVFQRPVLLRRSARANLAHALAVQGVARADRRPRIDAVLERTGLSELASRPARVLSAGEQQRLALARAWVLEPEVLFLDEPTASLDPAATRAVEALILAISAAGTKVVMTTHDLGQARRLADDAIFLHRGRVLERGPASEFFDDPRSDELRAFLKGDLLW